MNRQTYLEIDNNAIQHNINRLISQTNKSIMPVIKANAYGTGIDNMINLVMKNDIDIVCVALVSEGIYVREKGYTDKILILNQPFKADIENILKYDLTPGCCEIDFLKELNQKSKKKIYVHIEIDTGMSRTGVTADKIEKFVSDIKELNNIIVDGVYTHYATSDEVDQTYKLEQDKIFSKALEYFDKEKLTYIHTSNSGGIINGKNEIANAIRPGIMMYGYYPSEINYNNIELQPAARLVSKISFLKTVSKDTSISYGRRYITKNDTKIATVPIGYADGISRGLTNKGKVVINNTICNIVGSVCMDNILVDVTNVEDVKIDDCVYIWDNNNIKLEDVSRDLNTINYEVISGISARVERIYID